MAKVTVDNNITDEDDGMESSSITVLYTSAPPIVCFWIMTMFLIPALICSFTLLYVFFSDRKLRYSLNNHVIIALLLVGLFSLLFDVPIYLNFMRLGYVWPQTPTLCYFWCFVDLSCFNMLGFLMSWASIERHILVFHNHLVNTKRKRLLFHYLPLITIILYGLGFYAIVIFFPSCENEFDYTQNWCAYPCYYSQYHIMLFDTFVNCLLPIPLISGANILLVVRVLKKKQAYHQQMSWKKYRKMILQIISFSVLFLLFSLPMISFIIAHLCGVSYEATGRIERFFYFLSYFINILIPFVCLASLPEILVTIRRKFKNNSNRILAVNILIRPIAQNNL